MKLGGGLSPPFRTSPLGTRRRSRRSKRGDSRSAFVADVHQFVRRIPRGHVATYGQIAACLEHPRAARAVGWAMKHCPPGVPWHRVVNARGGISRRRNVGGMLTQRLLLEQEGIRVRGGRVSLHRHRSQDGGATLSRLQGARGAGRRGSRSRREGAVRHDTP
ncbi:MAG: hypothetical protein DMD82_12970 [Candidatus Rokuibacteriota bacterium]|nr:MAG: hypothetical protein DMD82_12970 [Candidatus Rokubacteria bacterium]